MVTRPNDSDVANLLQTALNDADYGEALRLLESIESLRALNCRELVFKARCLQLAPGNATNLERAQASLEAALKLDSEYLPALIELAWYEYAVEDNADRARFLFERAVSLSARDYREALTGLFKAIEDLDSASVASETIKKRVADTLDIEGLISRARNRS